MKSNSIPNCVEAIATEKPMEQDNSHKAKQAVCDDTCHLKASASATVHCVRPQQAKPFGGIPIALPGHNSTQWAEAQVADVYCAV